MNDKFERNKNICDDIDAGLSRKDAAKKYNVSYGRVLNIYESTKSKIEGFGEFYGLDGSVACMLSERGILTKCEAIKMVKSGAIKPYHIIGLTEQYTKKSHYKLLEFLVKN